jgi:hypothetical protein
LVPREKDRSERFSRNTPQLTTDPLEAAGRQQHLRTATDGITVCFGERKRGQITGIAIEDGILYRK